MGNETHDIYPNQDIPVNRCPILRYFEYTHLPLDIKKVVREFHALAYGIEHNLPNGEERQVALRKLLEAKDAAIRAALDI